MSSSAKDQAPPSVADSTARTSSSPAKSKRAPTTSPPPASAKVQNILISGTSSPALKPSPSGSRNASPTRKSDTNAPNVSAESSSALPPAAVHRALSATAAAEPTLKSPTAAHAEKGPIQRISSPRLGPGSPVIQSPELPSSSRRSSFGSTKQSDGEAAEDTKPNRVQKKSSNSAERNTSSSTQGQGLPSVKVPRGSSGLGSKLETVQERDHSPSPETPSMLASKAESHAKQTAAETTVSQEARPEATTPDKQATTDQKPPLPPNLRRQTSQSSLKPSKTRANTGEGTSKHMTVETETVASIPQTSIKDLGDRSGASRSEAGGSLRLKPSSETIRPKKERKKPSKKPPSIISGPGSSKADIFEAKVASEIEGGDSDSDDTFVYESNPPEPRSRQNRHHSRTPSATSLQSLADRRNGVKGHGLDGKGAMRSKRSMKFSSNPYASSSMDDEPGDRESGTVRATRSTPRNDLLYRRLGRETGGSDQETGDSPFSQASKLRVATGNGHRTPLKGGSPRSGVSPQARTPTRSGRFSPQHDLDGGGTDDERAPLIGSVRKSRTRNARQFTGSQLRQMEYYTEPRRNWIRRVAGCVALAIVIVLLLLFGAGFLYATTKPLQQVSIQKIHNVLASEQELMLDLLVEAINPNVAQIIVADMDVNIFAKSRHLEPEKPSHGGHGSRRRRAESRLTGPALGGIVDTPDVLADHLFPSGGVDKGTDPIDDPESDAQTMLLGRIFHFDSPLTFESSPLRRNPQNSSGELRLERPGNRTEEGGSKRWELVLQHPFELIVRGILKYQLPLSTRAVSASVGARVEVHPDEDADDDGNMLVVQLGRMTAQDETRT